MSQKRDKPLLIIEANNIEKIIDFKKNVENISNMNILKLAKNYLIKSKEIINLKSIKFSDSMIYTYYSPEILSKEWLDCIFEKLVIVYNNSNHFNFKRNIPVPLLKDLLETSKDVFCLRIVSDYSNTINTFLSDIDSKKLELSSTGYYIYFKSYDDMLYSSFYISLNCKLNFIMYSFKNNELLIE